jgi:hypothetical protein
MLNNSTSRRRVCLARNEHSGKPLHRLTISTSLGPALHVPLVNLTKGIFMSQEPLPFAAFIGIDWADKKHDVCLHVPGQKKRERSVLEHRPAAIRQRAQKLRERFGGAPIAVALELAQGPIVSALLEHDIFVLFPVQPTMLAKYRETFTPSRAKDDPTDAEFALELLLRYPERLPRLQPESADGGFGHRDHLSRYHDRCSRSIAISGGPEIGAKRRWMVFKGSGVGGIVLSA